MHKVDKWHQNCIENPRTILKNLSDQSIQLVCLLHFRLQLWLQFFLRVQDYSVSSSNDDSVPTAIIIKATQLPIESAKSAGQFPYGIKLCRFNRDSRRITCTSRSPSFTRPSGKFACKFFFAPELLPCDLVHFAAPCDTGNQSLPRIANASRIW